MHRWTNSTGMWLYLQPLSFNSKIFLFKLTKKHIILLLHKRIPDIFSFLNLLSCHITSCNRVKPALSAYNWFKWWIIVPIVILIERNVIYLIRICYLLGFVWLREGWRTFEKVISVFGKIAFHLSKKIIHISI